MAIKKKALLALADGAVFEGRSFGAETERIGEVVFNTSMTGYEEILSDPSYKGQIVTMTYTQMGNYGINIEDQESARPFVEGFIAREYLPFASNWRSKMPLGKYLAENSIPAIEGLDTRALTRHLREYGAQMGVISAIDTNPESLLQKVRAHPGIAAFDYVKEVTSAEPFRWRQMVWRWPEGYSLWQEKPGKKIMVYDYGVKFNILRNLATAGFAVMVVPARTSPERVLEMDPDAVVLSNGPGDPQTVTYAVAAARRLMGRKPVFGICLGHQILGIAMGGSTYKLKFGHHGGNHPVMDLETGRVEITSQNHNYCVDIESVKGKAVLTHKNLYDGTEEGMRHVELPVMSVQHHPEAGPGPNDASSVFKKFKEMLDKNA